MTGWRIRHEGSPKSVDGLTLAQVVEGLQDGKWEITDEVMGPGENQWVPIESHPQLAEVAADLEPPPPHEYEDESRVDMNALIDVCLVLLIFFMITTTYAALQKRMDAPNLPEKYQGVLGPGFVQERMIQVALRMEGGRPVIYVERKPVAPERLESELSKFVRRTRRTLLLLDFPDNVPHGAVVEVQDAAKGAGMEKVCLVVP